MALGGNKLNDTDWKELINTCDSNQDGKVILKLYYSNDIKLIFRYKN